MGLPNNRWPRMFPLSGETPGGGKDTLWLSLSVYELTNQTGDARDRGGIQTNGPVDNMAFLLPKTFQETLDHNWEEHQGIAQRLGDVIQTSNQAWKELQSAGRLDLRSAQVSKEKPDAPLVYKGTSRRQLSLTFGLADQGSIYYDVLHPVIELQKYSSPTDKNDAILYTIEFPHVFKLSVIDGNGSLSNLTSMEWASLQAVQPTYNGPYRNGSPSSCELTLTFIELEPVYKKIFERRSKRVSSSMVGARR